MSEEPAASPPPETPVGMVPPAEAVLPQQADHHRSHGFGRVVAGLFRRGSLAGGASHTDVVMSDGRLHSDEAWEQHHAALTYQESIDLRPAGSAEQLSPSEIAARLESQHVVKWAPRLPEQLAGPPRDQRLTYTAGLNRQTVRRQAEELTEQHVPDSESNMLAGLDSFLGAAEVTLAKHGDAEGQKIARSLRENVTFIGGPELDEATGGLAAYWKELLAQNPQQKLWVMTNDLSGSFYYEGQVKSGQYLLDKILGHFSDDELHAIAGRLLVDEAAAHDHDAANTRVILLDDWTISGQQLLRAAQAVIDKHPQLRGHIEAQLLAASKQRLAMGLRIPDDYPRELSLPVVPVRAYFMAHGADPQITEYDATHITGAHSSVDYDFEVLVDNLLQRLHAAGDEMADAVMPPATSLVRPYAHTAYLPNIDRYRRYQSMK